jgi:putative ABC transport system permease protein
LKRANEVGVRKVVGASQSNLIVQFLGESLLLNILALVLALALIAVLQPLFNTLIGRQLSILTLGSTTLWIYSLVILLVGSLLAGTYTAYSLSNYKPVETLKGKITKTTNGIVLRKSLVVSQFSISIALVLATILTYSQLEFMKNKELGVKLDQLLVISGPEVGLDSTYNSRRIGFFEEISNQTYVKDYCNSNSIPGKYFNFATAGFTQPSSKEGDQFKSYSFAIIGSKYFNTYGVKMLAGRNFTFEETKVEWNQNSKIILNERAMEQFGFRSTEEALRQKIKWDERYLEVIGIVKDYHHSSLQTPIEPIIFYPQNSNAYITIQLTPDRWSEKVTSLENIYRKYFPGNPFDYSFVDESFNKAYLKEQQYGKLFTTASLWAIIIACLGLFGLATFTVESRTKEIGIRKVLGAGTIAIVKLLSKDFIVLVFVSIFIGCPISYYFMSHWLNDFAYRISIEWYHFAYVSVFALLIAMLSVSYQSIKAALMKPVKSIKIE